MNDPYMGFEASNLFFSECPFSEAATGDVLYKNVSLKISQN